eukprot:141488-Pleurochrysis_carterae.AAC.1
MVMNYDSLKRPSWADALSWASCLLGVLTAPPLLASNCSKVKAYPAQMLDLQLCLLAIVTVTAANVAEPRRHRSDQRNDQEREGGNQRATCLACSAS